MCVLLILNQRNLLISYTSYSQSLTKTLNKPCHDTNFLQVRISPHTLYCQFCQMSNHIKSFTLVHFHISPLSLVNTHSISWANQLSHCIIFLSLYNFYEGTEFKVSNTSETDSFEQENCTQLRQDCDSFEHQIELFFLLVALFQTFKLPLFLRHWGLPQDNKLMHVLQCNSQFKSHFHFCAAFELIGKKMEIYRII